MEVAKVPEVKLPMPWMERRLPGLVVPIPTFPFCITLKSWPCAPTKRVEVAMSADEVVVPVIWALPDWMERREPGDVVPRPKDPLLSMVSCSMLFALATTNDRANPLLMPLTESLALGLEDPIPVLPELRSIQRRGEEVPTAKEAEPVGVEDATYRGPANEEVAVVEVE